MRQKHHNYSIYWMLNDLRENVVILREQIEDLQHENEKLKAKIEVGNG